MFDRYVLILPRILKICIKMVSPPLVHPLISSTLIKSAFALFYIN